ncbi:DUF1810 family protein [Polaromonas sp. JS666]|uniref:DUF1810 family protein n=1 Tax=Polaromonas sp. (strain JS666 / ATCC BAA-500) TaxID=296591 RepID=UPI00350F889F
MDSNRHGHNTSHWMWFIFPWLRELVSSSLQSTTALLPAKRRQVGHSYGENEVLLQ